MTSVLVVEEDAAAAEIMVGHLRRKGYGAGSVHTGGGALKLHRKADLLLLDLDLPDIDGLEVCRSVRAAGNTPIISFTGHDDELDRVLALQAGADDCMHKSCGLREVMARIEAVLRRSRPEPAALGGLSLPPLHLDPRTREVRLDDRPVDVTAKEFDLLYALAASPGAVVPRRELMARVWGGGHTSRTIDTHVSSLRTKLGAPGWILTVRGVGYRIGHAPPPASNGGGC